MKEVSPYSGRANKRGPEDIAGYADDILEQVYFYAAKKETLVLADIYACLENLARECAWLRARVGVLEAVHRAVPVRKKTRQRGPAGNIPRNGVAIEPN